uniref:BEN domain-containing protein n=1 Tax=Clytia hemisphaerica TaxID=252671 RepID=A0A7M5X217_9CNID
TLEGINFLDYQKVKRPTKMVTLLAKKLKDGIIEPGRAIKNNVRILDGEKLALLKGLLKHHYGDKFTSNLWRSCRESINQCARDMRRTSSNAAAAVAVLNAVADEEDDDDEEDETV